MDMYISGYNPSLKRFCWQDGKASREERFDAVANLSYGTFEGQRLYLVSERGEADSAVAVYDIAGQKPILLGTAASSGASPCYVSVCGDWLAAANYMGGSIDLYRLDAQGLPVLTQTIRHNGRGVDPRRQEAPHMHFTRFISPDTLCAIDLGIDEVRLYGLNRDSWQLRQAVRLEPGSGPRHMALSSRTGLMYVLCELKPFLYALDMNDSDRVICQKLDFSEGDLSTPIFGSGIRLSLDERTLYAGLRGVDRLVSVKLTEDGRMGTWQSCACGGTMPREITLSPDGCFLAVANQTSDNVCVFAIDAQGEIGEQIQDIPAEKPTWIGFYEPSVRA